MAGRGGGADLAVVGSLRSDDVTGSGGLSGNRSEVGTWGGGGGLISWPRLSTAGAEVIKCRIFSVYTRDELVEPPMTTKTHQQQQKQTVQSTPRTEQPTFGVAPCTLPSHPRPWGLEPCATIRALKQQHLLPR